MAGIFIDIPAWRRFFVVRGIIVPFRAPNAAKLYREGWDEETGSPLLHYSLHQQRLLQERLGDEYHVELAMRYQNPSIASALAKLKRMNLEQLRIIPLFPQYASASTGSVIDKVMELMHSWHTFPEDSTAKDYYSNEMMIDLYVETGFKI